MELYKEYCDWFRQFKIDISQQERRMVKEFFISGYNCPKYNRCPFFHMVAAVIANMRNNHILEFLIQDALRSFSSDEWVHLTDKAGEFYKALETVDKKTE